MTARTHSSEPTRREPTKGLLIVQDVAVRLCLSPYTIYNWISQGRIAYCHVGRQVRFHEQDVEEMIQRVERRDL